MLNYVVWDVDPVAFHLFGMEIRWYGVLFAVVFALGFGLISHMLKKEGNKPELADSLLFYVAIATIIGARLGHCLFYEPRYYLSHPIEIFYFRDGGLASHGGAIAIVIALILVARKYKKSFWYLTDRVVITVAIGGCLIRLGNLINSEIYGEATTLPWGFIFVRNHETLAKHPTQIYEALSYLILFFALYFYYLKKDRKPKEGVIFGWFLIVLFGMRFLIEFIKEVQEPWELNYMLNMGQMLSIPFIILGIIVLYLAYNEKLPYSTVKSKIVKK